MKIVGFIGYIWMPKWRRYSPCSYQRAVYCCGFLMLPVRCWLDEDYIFLPTSISESKFWSLYRDNYLKNRI